jgi:dihydrofolate reductase
MEISLIVAVCENGGIGVNNTIPWYIPEDLKHFRKITTDAPVSTINAVIMGRKTWQSLPKQPLPNRLNVVVSSTLNKGDYVSDNIVIVQSLQEALDVIQTKDNIHKAYVIGGSTLYKEAILSKMCDSAFVTHVHDINNNNITCDTFFPLDELHDTFSLASESLPYTHDNLEYKFSHYRQKQ